MGFNKDTGNTDGNGSARQGLDEFSLTARRAALPARLLNRMGRIKDDRRAERSHDR
ncbi:hypothetical protein D3C71_2139530 [compost metagenome]